MKNNNIGRCYELNFLFQVRNPDYKLVHGYITSIFPPYQTIDHAWCIKGDIVYDAVLEKEFPKIVYDGLYKTEIGVIYTHEEAMNKTLETGHYGYWHKIKDLELDKHYENGKLKEEFRKELED